MDTECNAFSLRVLPYTGSWSYLLLHWACRYLRTSFSNAILHKEICFFFLNACLIPVLFIYFGIGARAFIKAQAMDGSSDRMWMCPCVSQGVSQDVDVDICNAGEEQNDSSNRQSEQEE